jgi:hypothetical protein
MEVQMQAAAETGDVGDGIFEESELAARGPLRGVLINSVGAVANDVFEVDTSEEVLVRLGDLTEDGIRLHILNVGLDQRRAFFDRLDDDLFADDGFIDEGVLRRGGFAVRRDVAILLLLARMQDACSGMRRKGGCDEECQ